MLKAGFKSITGKEKREKLRNIITCKAAGLSEEHLQMILAAMDPELQYSITGTANLNTFLKNAYREDGGDLFQVSVTPVYGDLVPGFSDNDGCQEDASCPDEPSAFIKTVTVSFEGKTKMDNYLFIYQKRFGSC